MPTHAAYDALQEHNHEAAQPLLPEQQNVEAHIEPAPPERHNGPRNAPRRHRAHEDRIDLCNDLITLSAIFLISGLLGFGGGIFSHCQCK